MTPHNGSGLGLRPQPNTTILSGPPSDLTTTTYTGHRPDDDLFTTLFGQTGCEPRRSKYTYTKSARAIRMKGEATRSIHAATVFIAHTHES